jgi:hypothetical protein
MKRGQKIYMELSFFLMNSNLLSGNVSQCIKEENKGHRDQNLSSRKKGKREPRFSKVYHTKT